MSIHLELDTRQARAVLKACVRQRSNLQKKAEKRPFTPAPGKIDVTAAILKSLDTPIQVLSHALDK